MLVTVHSVSIPAWSTIGFGEGLSEDGFEVSFVGDHRPMRELGQLVAESTDPVVAAIEDWQLTRRGR